jgi:AraC family transcriptional regulator of adaptative response/methylated-DNA-[protein]-cysteine methyltransferase
MIEKTKTLFDRDLSENELSKNILVCIKRASEQELKNITLDYSFCTTDFGDVILASTEKGISYLAFENQKDKAFEDLKKRFPMALFQEKSGTP